MGDWQMDNRKFLMTLRDDFIAKGHPVRYVSAHFYECVGVDKNFPELHPRYDLALRPQVWKTLFGGQAVRSCQVRSVPQHCQYLPTSLLTSHLVATV